MYEDTATGILYGTTELGGKYEVGVLYSFNPATNKDSVLINFDTSGGGPSSPLSGFIRASNGLLYSMAPGGGENQFGVIYSFNISTGILDTLFSFNSTDGASPWGSNLLQLPSGLMYGMTIYGGSSFNGTFFSFDPSTNMEKVLVNFSSINGANPAGSVIEDPDNDLLYGMTYDGGAQGEGNVFSYDVINSIYTNIFDFNGTNGGYPTSGFTLVKDTSISTGVNKISTSVIVKLFPNPNNGIFTISLSHAKLVSASQTKIEIYNVLGEKVTVATLKQVQGDNLINLSGQPSGVYFYRVSNESGEMMGSGKFVIE